MKLYKSFGYIYLLIFFSFVFFVFFIGNTYYKQPSLRFYADSIKYVNIFKDEKNLVLISLSQNLLGPVLLLKFTNNNNLLILLINVFLLLVSVNRINYEFEFDKNIRKKLALWFISNPMVFFSLLLVNKEILGLFGISMYICYLKSKKKKYFFLAVIVGFLTRWQEGFVILVFSFIKSKVNPFRKRNDINFWILILGISVTYPFVGKLIPRKELLFQYREAFGLLSMCNWLQEHYLFFMAVIPKMVLNIFGNIFRIFYIISSPQLIIEDFYNNFVVIGHQIVMFVLLVKIISKKKIKLYDDIIFFGLVYLVIFSISLMIQYRYIFPVYIIFVLTNIDSSKNKILRGR